MSQPNQSNQRTFGKLVTTEAVDGELKVTCRQVDGSVCEENRNASDETIGTSAPSVGAGETTCSPGAGETEDVLDDVLGSLKKDVQLLKREVRENRTVGKRRVSINNGDRCMYHHHHHRVTGVPSNRSDR